MYKHVYVLIDSFKFPNFSHKNNLNIKIYTEVTQDIKTKRLCEKSANTSDLLTRNNRSTLIPTNARTYVR